MGSPVSCILQGIRIIIESPGGLSSTGSKTGLFLYLRRSPARRALLLRPRDEPEVHVRVACHARDLLREAVLPHVAGEAELVKGASRQGDQ